MRFFNTQQKNQNNVGHLMNSIEIMNPTLCCPAYQIEAHKQWVGLTFEYAEMWMNGLSIVAQHFCDLFSSDWLM